MTMHSLPLAAFQTTPFNPETYLSKRGGAQNSARARILNRRTYLRPRDENGVDFETPKEMLDRVIGHQRWLWEKQIKRALNPAEEAELAELRLFMDLSLISASGRVKWMGGTDIIKQRSSAAFNCAFTEIRIPADFVDAFWLLLQGVGVGFKPKLGILTGFSSTVREVRVIGSDRKDKGGQENTTQTFEPKTGVWTITFGDSAKGWAKALGKLMHAKHRATTLVLDFSELRPGGKRLKGYGWLSSGWKRLAEAMEKIAKIMIERAEQPLTAINIGDIMNLLGTVLSSRRSAEIWLMDDHDPEIEEFITAKIGRYENGKEHREQSNNTIQFWKKPERETLETILRTIYAGGDPGFKNAAEAKRRAPDYVGCNPCAEIMLPSKGFCNLFQVVWHRFNGDYEGLQRAQYIAGRANYRQTCVSMRDGVLQPEWDDNQHLLRLCGVSPTGYVSWEGANDPFLLEGLRTAARQGADDMADAFGTPRARRVTQVQPAGTSSKVLGVDGDEVHEGLHLADSRFIFNNVNISNGEPLLDALIRAGYRHRPNPVDSTSTLVTLPVAYPESPLFTKVPVEINGETEILEINLESAISQLERYRLIMNHYVDHNASITISYDEDEIPAMADWFDAHWDEFVGVSFLKRNDLSKTAADPEAAAKALGFSYLPQIAVSERMYNDYVATLWPLDLSQDTSFDLLDVGAECSTGACPIR